MTQEQFNDIRFGKDMKAIHVKYGEGTIIGVDFDEKLINLSLPEIIGDNWCRCENILLMKEQMTHKINTVIKCENCKHYLDHSTPNECENCDDDFSGFEPIEKEEK